MKLNRHQFVAVVAVLALGLAACGGNPAGPSDEGVTLEGTVVGGHVRRGLRARPGVGGGADRRRGRATRK